MKAICCFILIIGCCLSFTASKAQDLSAYSHEYMVTGRYDTLKYRMLLPNNFDPKKQYPLVFFLHGAGERGNDNEAQMVHGGSLFLEQREKYPAVVVFPQCKKGDYWADVNITRVEGKRTFNFAADAVPTHAMVQAEKLLDALLALKYIDKSRVYAVGLSMGGMGTFEIVSRRPDVFAAAIPICGGDNPNSAQIYAEKVPFWIFHGEKDSIVPVEHSKVMAKAINDAGGNAKLTLYENIDHNSWNKAFKEPDFLEWLFQQSLNK